MYFELIEICQSSTKRKSTYKRTEKDNQLLQFAQKHNLAPPPVPSGEPDEKTLTIAEKVAL